MGFNQSTMCSNKSQVEKSTVNAKWIKFATPEDTARIAVQYGNYLACKRRQLLKQIKLSKSRRNGFNSTEEENTEMEHWSWQPNNSYDDSLQLQAVNCSVCGNYKKVSDTNFVLCDQIVCCCDDAIEWSSDTAEVAEEEYKYEGDNERTTVVYN